MAFIGTKTVIWRLVLGCICLLGASAGVHSAPYAPRAYYGARLEPLNKVLHGAGQMTSASAPQNYGFERYADVMGPRRYPMVFMSYVGMGRPDLQRLKRRIDALQAQGIYVIPQIGLYIPPEGMPEERYEKSLEMLCNQIESLNRPVYLRIGYEFNGTWYTPMYEPKSYIALFRLVTAKLRERGLPVATLWCAYPGYSPHYGSWEYMRQFYPGDDSVDWFSIDIFQPTDITNPMTRTFLDQAEMHGKPVMIGEATPCTVGADDAADWQVWFEPFFKLIHERKGIKGHTYINWDWAGTRWPTWGDDRLETADEYVRSRYLAEMSSDLYLDAGPEPPGFALPPDPGGAMLTSPGAWSFAFWDRVSFALPSYIRIPSRR